MRQFTEASMGMTHRIQRLELLRPVTGTCPGCGHDGAYRVLFRTDRSPPRVQCAACRDRFLIVVEFVKVPLPADQRTNEDVPAGADAWLHRLNQGAST
ncbi:MAG: hypothetical protein AB7G11_17695 [Phycisphaerales bacterium]